MNRVLKRVPTLFRAPRFLMTSWIRSCLGLANASLALGKNPEGFSSAEWLQKVRRKTAYSSLS